MEVTALKILVSACLMGHACRYDGHAKVCEKILRLAGAHTLIPFCPEIYGGLPTPRMPCECKDGRVLRADGADCTAAYQKGAAEALALCRRLEIRTAILKARSPSCGHGQIYDGTFTGRLVRGDGVTAALLLQNGVAVYSEEDRDFLEPSAEASSAFFAK